MEAAGSSGGKTTRCKPLSTSAYLPKLVITFQPLLQTWMYPYGYKPHITAVLAGWHSFFIGTHKTNGLIQSYLLTNKTIFYASDIGNYRDPQ